MGEICKRSVWGTGRGRGREARGPGNLSSRCYGHPGPWRAPRSRGQFLFQDGPSRGPQLATSTKVAGLYPLFHIQLLSPKAVAIGWQDEGAGWEEVVTSLYKEYQKSGALHTLLHQGIQQYGN